MNNISIISPENTMLILTIIILGASISIILEQKYKWAASISGAIIALVFAMTLSNLSILPLESKTYDMVWAYIVPLSIPLLLMSCNLKKIAKESGRLFIIFVIGAIGTTIGSFLAFFCFNGQIPELEGISAMMTGTYIGGSVNLASLASSFTVSSKMVSASVVADNLLMVLYFLVLMIFPTLSFFKNNFPHIQFSDGENIKEYWSNKEISLKDIAMIMSITFVIVSVSKLLSSFISYLIPNTNNILILINSFISNEYLLITTISVILTTLFHNFFSKLLVSQEIGIFFIYIFFFTIGIPASLTEIIRTSPLLLVFCSIIVFVNMIVIFISGKLLKFTLEEIILASNANIGGPTTAAAMAISKGWSELVPSILLVGTFGNVIGTYLGIFVGNVLLMM